MEQQELAALIAGMVREKLQTSDASGTVDGLAQVSGTSGTADGLAQTSGASGTADGLAQASGASGTADELAQVSGASGTADELAQVSGASGTADEPAQVSDVQSAADNATKQRQDFTSHLAATKPVLTLEAAKMLLACGEEKAASIGVPMVITLVDDGGNIKAQHRMDDSLLASIAISAEKAYAALALRSSTEQAAKTILPGQPLYGLQDTHPGKFCLFGGGIPLFYQGTCFGAVGVSGGTVEQDVSVAEWIREKAEESQICDN